RTFLSIKKEAAPDWVTASFLRKDIILVLIINYLVAMYLIILLGISKLRFVPCVWDTYAILLIVC
ncbi:MAG: hypothetical protein Q4G58_06680, partial [bacterium]|nr:hypothetical protein [bacterium]